MAVDRTSRDPILPDGEDESHFVVVVIVDRRRVVDVIVGVHLDRVHDRLRADHIGTCNTRRSTAIL